MLAALADAHAPIAALASRHARGELSVERLVQGALMAVLAYAVNRCLAA